MTSLIENAFFLSQINGAELLHIMLKTYTSFLAAIQIRCLVF
ncbi:hypothetical protein HCUR_00466 [Holospora curviuscula]|uniref:Uncharacterized protein n=1 Tax=Holospora curviuscula TaxID=1082868 RepID=A0A2S5RAX1_9PROT|nr:hypothetical protein HCUR_00466 [Holospora curviuscula]